MPTMEAVKIDAKKLQEARLAKFLSRDELADASGIHRDHIGRLERGGYEGESRPPTVRKLAEALGIDPRKLLSDDA
jgi:transcriptional regulator with XRE-family HTH domain